VLLDTTYLPEIVLPAVVGSAVNAVAPAKARTESISDTPKASTDKHMPSARARERTLRRQLARFVIFFIRYSPI
jgi:hypothetical protein